MEYKKLAESMSDSAKIARYFGERILLTSGSEAIKDLLSTVEELEAKNKRLEQARENANEACAKWEGLYRAELEKKSGKAAWIRVENRLPERFCPVIVCRKDGKVEAGQKDVGDWWRVYGTRIKTVSYWMPLPEPPKEE